MKKFVILSASLLIILSVLAIVQSCKKDDQNIKIHGSVNDPVQQIPVGDAEVLLYARVFEGGMYNPNPVIVASVKTDANGDFVIELDKIKADDFSITINKQKYISLTEDIDNSSIEAGKTYTPDYLLDPEGWLNLKVTNTYPVNINDYISFAIIEGFLTCSQCCNPGYVQGAGENYYYESTCRAKANSDIKIVWNVTKSNGVYGDTAVVSIPLFDTASYHIIY